MSAPDERKYLHALIRAGLSARALSKIEAALGSWREGFEHPEALQSAGLSPEALTPLQKASTLNPNDLMRDLIRENTIFILKTDPESPELLKTIPSPPPALYIKGSLPHHLPYLAVVGTRKASAYGREAVKKIIRDLAN